MSEGEEKDREEPADPQDIDNAGALAALRRASIKARLRALEISGAVAIYRDGKIVYESDPKVLFPDGTDPEAPSRDRGKAMFACGVCHAGESREELVDEVFHVDGRYVLVSNIPAVVCDRCEEQVFSRETAERVRLMVHDEGRAKRSVSMQVFDFPSQPAAPSPSP